MSALRPGAARWSRALGVVALGASVLGATFAGAASQVAPPRGVTGWPGPASGPPAPGADRVAIDATCEGCHEDVAAEWRGSLHHASWDDPIFLTAHAIEPQPFCRSCHAPEADPGAAPSEAARRLGIGCVTCHLRGDRIVGPRARAAREGAHAVVGDPRLAGAGACTACHQFEFPEPQDAAMQGTGEEHRASRFAAMPCQECHMPRLPGGGTRRHHGFHVDEALLRSAVRVTAARDGERSVAITITPARVGHDVPTGDMFRRLEVRATAIDDPRAVASTSLARRFRRVPGPEGTRRLQVGDDRIRGGGPPRRVVLDLDPALDGRPLRWEVVHQRMDPAMAASFGVDPARNETIVASGTLR